MSVLPNLVPPNNCHDTAIECRCPGVAGNRVAFVGTYTGLFESAELAKLVTQHAAPFKALFGSGLTPLSVRG
jgi:phage gp37-like protein